MVIMALATTFMTGPALNLIDLIFKPRKNSIPNTSDNLEYKVLVSFENPEDGKPLLKVANNFISLEKEKQSLSPICQSCPFKGHCLTEHYRYVRDLTNSCNGYRGLLEYYEISDALYN
jgi:hypothetical protein